jgi:hypothetical protein
MGNPIQSILLIGESGVGKTHYGAQLLKRLMNSRGKFRMNGAATNLEPFETTLECLNEGRAAGHTPTSTYLDSGWPIVSDAGEVFSLVWPDYGGEQVKNMLSTRRVLSAWKTRVMNASAWLLMLRLNQLRTNEDLLSRPLATLAGPKQENSTDDQLQLPDQARMIELLQMLLFLREQSICEAKESPRLCVLLSCWDELGQTGQPVVMLRQRLPLFADFVFSNWKTPIILGLSALGRSLDKNLRDEEYVAQGPEQFGYVVLPGGESSSDLTVPIKMLLRAENSRL